jgi:hypothetical protein
MQGIVKATGEERRQADAVVRRADLAGKSTEIDIKSSVASGLEVWLQRNALITF